LQAVAFVGCVEGHTWHVHAGPPIPPAHEHSSLPYSQTSPCDEQEAPACGSLTGHAPPELELAVALALVVVVPVVVEPPVPEAVELAPPVPEADVADASVAEPDVPETVVPEVPLTEEPAPPFEPVLPTCEPPVVPDDP
jgi:hypothetical protein